jgi:hypothetical protein
MDQRLREIERWKKAITCGTAAGAKQGSTKGNKQSAKYGNQERMHGKPGRKEWGKRGSVSGSEALWKPL